MTTQASQFVGSIPPRSAGETLQAGFVSVDIEHVPQRSKTHSAQQFAQGVVFGSPLYGEILARDGNAEEIRKVLTERLEREFGGELPLQALVVHARLQ
jgi:hypothetical protein